MGRGRKRKEKPAEPEGASGGPIFREIEAPIDAGEMLASFKAFADDEQTVDSLTAELARQRQQLAQAKKDRETSKRKALHLARTGKGLVRVEVTEVIDEARGVVRLVRKDDPSVEVDTRALTAGEIQALSVARPGEVAGILQDVAARAEAGKVGAYDFEESDPEHRNVPAPEVVGIVGEPAEAQAN